MKRRRAAASEPKLQTAAAAAHESWVRQNSYSLTQDEALADLRWWHDKLEDPEWTGARSVQFSLEPPVVVMSDASGEEGWGYHQIDHESGIDLDGVEGVDWGRDTWTEQQLSDWKDDMLCKELYPVVEACERLGSRWTGRTVVFGTDNTGVVYGLNAGRVHDHRGRALMRRLAELQQQHQFEIMGQWVPRELNDVADQLSRQKTLREAVAHAYPSLPSQAAP
jgi:hypothetical protein